MKKHRGIITRQKGKGGIEKLEQRNKRGKEGEGEERKLNDRRKGGRESSKATYARRIR